MRTPRSTDGFTTLDDFLGEEGAREAFQAQPVVPREWFLVPLFAIDEAVGKIKDGAITGYVHDPRTAKPNPAP